MPNKEIMILLRNYKNKLQRASELMIKADQSSDRFNQDGNIEAAKVQEGWYILFRNQVVIFANVIADLEKCFPEVAL